MNLQTYVKKSKNEFGNSSDLWQKNLFTELITEPNH